MSNFEEQEDESHDNVSELSQDSGENAENSQESSANSAADDIRAAISEVESAKSVEPTASKEQKAPKSAKKTQLEAAPKISNDQTPGKVTEEGAPESAPLIPAPISWSSDEKELFGKLPPDLQRSIAEREGKRERVFHQKSEELAHLARNYGELAEAVEPFAEYVEQQLKVPMSQAIGYMFKGQQFLDQFPEQAIQRLAQMHGVDLAELAVSPATPGKVSPEIFTLRKELDEVRSVLRQRTQQDEQSVNQRLASEVEAFKARADESGAAKYPYLKDPTFEIEMAHNVRLIRSQQPQAAIGQVLEAAYDRTVWANPDARANELKRQQAIKAAEAARTAKAAKAAAISVTGAPGGASRVRSSGSVADDLRETMAELGFL
ncbi:MAG: hypothetical protein E6Q97_00775 [Desulfurellales bacterium]|nr:MAG: hypothetical protein E6Q97_00775 [Desulfurellales bacterium]